MLERDKFLEEIEDTFAAAAGALSLEDFRDFAMEVEINARITADAAAQDIERLGAEES